MLSQHSKLHRLTAWGEQEKKWLDVLVVWHKFHIKTTGKTKRRLYLHNKLHELTPVQIQVASCKRRLDKPSYMRDRTQLRATWIRVRGEERGGSSNYQTGWHFCCYSTHSDPLIQRWPVKKNLTLRACSLACSSSKACCFSFSSMRLKDMPVEEREETALDKVDALQDTRQIYLFSLLSYGVRRQCDVIETSTWCRHSTPWSSCPPGRPGAAPKPPGGC